MDFKEWTEREIEAKKIGLGTAIQNSQSVLAKLSTVERAREFLWISRLNELDQNFQDALIFKFMSFICDGDSRTLFLICIQTFNKLRVEICNVSCDLYLSKFEENSKEIRLIKCLCLAEMGEILAVENAPLRLDPKVSVWLRGKIYTPQDLNSFPC